MSKARKDRRPARKKPIPLGQVIREDKQTFIVYLALHVIILAIIVYSAIIGRFENIFSGALSILLLLIPPIIERSFHVKLPATLEILAYLFVFASSILGEIADFYRIFPFWDVILHAFNGFMFAAFGFCLVDIFNKDKRFRFTLSPFFLAFVAFCFSMTIGVLWEFFEYAADTLLLTDMQKDVFRDSLHTVTLPNALGEKVTHITGIESVQIITKDGQIITMNGYLDPGLTDTVKDLLVNFGGAVLFSIIGFFYVKREGKGRIAKRFIPTYRDNQEPPQNSEERTVGKE